MNAWQGYQIDYPDGWRILYPPIDGVAFDSPDGNVFLEFSQIQAASALEALRRRLATIPQHEARLLEDKPEQAALLFRQGDCSGELRGRWRQGQATVVLAQSRQPINLTELIRTTLRSLRSLEPIPRHSWSEPLENSLKILCPSGWRIDNGFGVDGFGIRQPICRVSLNPHTFLHIEAEFRGFTQGPPEFYGDVHLPMRGLFPVLEGGFLARWGAQVLAFEDFGNSHEADARLRLPDGLIRVAKLSAAALPNSPRWVGGLCYYYQAAPDEIDRLEPIFRGLARSHQINPNWQNHQRMAQNAQFQQQHAQQTQQWMNLSQNLHQQRMHDIQMQGQANTTRHEIRQNISDSQMSGFQERMHSSDQMHHDNINSIRERADYLDPQTGQVHNFSAHHQQVWSDGQGHWLAADWDIQPPPDWHQLKRLDPGHPRP